MTVKLTITIRDDNGHGFEIPITDPNHIRTLAQKTPTNIKFVFENDDEQRIFRSRFSFTGETRRKKTQRHTTSRWHMSDTDYTNEITKSFAKQSFFVK